MVDTARIATSVLALSSACEVHDTSEDSFGRLRVHFALRVITIISSNSANFSSCVCVSSAREAVVFSQLHVNIRLRCIKCFSGTLTHKVCWASWRGILEIKHFIQ